MTLGNFAAIFVVPPVNLAVLAALLLILGRRRLSGLALALLLVLAMPVTSNLLLAALERGEEAGDPSGAQAIVVLGAEVTQQADGRAIPGLLSLGRLRTAAALARRTGLPLLVSGGVTQGGTTRLAVAMADSLRDDFVIPARWIEDRSLDTFANARDSAAILRPLGIRTVLVVTDQWHMRRAMVAFRTTGLRAIAAPCAPLGRWHLDLDGFLPHATGWMRSYYALHEWIGLGWYWIRATL